MAPADTKNDAAKEGPPDLSSIPDLLDPATFDQILEMDDEDDKDFSKGIVYGFFEQAESTFKQMETALKNEKMDELSSLGHFLKGSSATLGLVKVKDSCEKIQHLGAGQDETGTAKQPDTKVSLKSIETVLKDVKRDYAEVEVYLRRFYGEKVEAKKEEKEKKDEKEAEQPKESKPTSKEAPAKEEKKSTEEAPKK
ncbi:signal transduction histidine kinase [Penicillium capsulatum]|uniref:Signal transduction histidine kinase n=1 Tax=Penicillium capsulatum TaxID=69766 RepID=A0A9W9HUD5_9EURO|nr:signal transduction histidine kinase [Penicillium capsulatum]KAJ6105419.1 signal transduction histidine kinase [Penicillium capsulatum]